MKNLNTENKVFHLQINLNTILWFICLFYLLVVTVSKILYFHLFQTFYNESIFNFIPFARITLVSYKFIILNILIFIPVGIFYKLMSTKSIFKIIILVLFSFLLEVLQAVLKIGVFDISTIIFNMIGFFIGIYVFVQVKKIKKKQIEK